MPAPSLDVDRARAETPGCARLIHLNNAGASLVPQPVLDAQLGWLQEEAVTGGYELAERRADDVGRVYDEVARLIGARRDEIALVENATLGWHQAFWSLPLQAGATILTGRVEYATGYMSFLQAQQRCGIRIEVLPDDADGQTSVDALEARLAQGGVGLVAITHIPTNGGLVNPAAAIGALTRAAGVPYLLDACQSVGQMPIDVDEIGCDLLSATGRKFLRGPRGTGFLYARAELLPQLEPAFLDLSGADWVAPDRYEIRPDARRFENWEFNLAAVIGLGTAAAYAQDWGLDAIGERVAGLAARFREGLDALAGVEVRDIGRVRSGIVTFTKDGVDATKIKEALGAQAINVSVSLPPSTLLDAERRDLPPIVRASVHYYTTDAELERVCAAVDQL